MLQQQQVQVQQQRQQQQILIRNTSRLCLVQPFRLFHLLLVVVVVFGYYPLICESLQHSFQTYHDRRDLIGPVGVPFGFANGGKYVLQVHDFELTLSSSTSTSTNDDDDDEIDDKKAFHNNVIPGFYLQRFDNDASYTKYYNQLSNNRSICSFEYYLDDDDDIIIDGDDDDTIIYDEVGDIKSAEHGILLMMTPKQMKWKPKQPTIEYTFTNPNEIGLYYLTYQICNKKTNTLLSNHHHDDEIRSSFRLDFHFLNIDPITGQYSYLPVGEMRLPFVFFIYAICYLICIIVWIQKIYHTTTSTTTTTTTSHIHSSRQKQSVVVAGKKTIVYPIHKLMTALVIFKFLSILLESIRYHVIARTGHAKIWSILYYTITFIKGIFLFTVLLLLGTGWSILKPYLHDNEKKIICTILLLQIINNIAIIMLSNETNGEIQYTRWNSILHIVDILCCCFILLPIVWQVTSLEKSLQLPKQSSKQSSKSISTISNKKITTTQYRMDEHDLPDDDEDDVDEEEELLNNNDDDYHDHDHHNNKEQQILSKLKLFRCFYILVITYIYITRIIVYIFATLLNYQYLWIRYAIVEFITILFYIIVGILFHKPIIKTTTTDDNNNERNEQQQQQFYEKNDDPIEETGIALVSTRKTTTTRG